jgi:hypothetical protein
VTEERLQKWPARVGLQTREFGRPRHHRAYHRKRRDQSSDEITARGLRWALLSDALELHQKLGEIRVSAPETELDPSFSSNVRRAASISPVTSEPRSPDGSTHGCVTESTNEELQAINDELRQRSED